MVFNLLYWLIIEEYLKCIYLILILIDLMMAQEVIHQVVKFNKNRKANQWIIKLLIDHSLIWGILDMVKELIWNNWIVQGIGNSAENIKIKIINLKFRFQVPYIKNLLHYIVISNTHLLIYYSSSSVFPLRRQQH